MLEYSPTQTLLNQGHLLSIAQHTWHVTSPDFIWATPALLISEHRIWSGLCVCAPRPVSRTSPNLLLNFFEVSLRFFPKNEEQVMMNKPLRSPSEFTKCTQRMCICSHLQDKRYPLQPLCKVLTSNSTWKPWFDNFYKELCLCEMAIFDIYLQNDLEPAKLPEPTFKTFISSWNTPEFLPIFCLSWFLSWNLWLEPLTAFQNLMAPTMATIEDQHKTTWEKGSNPAQSLPL